MAASVIGVSLGTRIIGVAVMKNKELIIYKTKTFTGPWTKKKAEQILCYIHSITKYYRIERFAIKTVNPIHSSSGLDDLFDSIMKKSQNMGIEIITYSLQDIKDALKLTSIISIGEFVSNKHLELRKLYLKEINSAQTYYSKMFEAIALTELFKQNNK
jgi:hypothetical protein